MRRKTPISESRKPEVKSPVDVIGYYPVRGKGGHALCWRGGL